MTDRTYIEYDLDLSTLTEVEQVSLWRFEVLVRTGYPPTVAADVARSGADLHLAVDLVEQGCEPMLAARIVL